MPEPRLIGASRILNEAALIEPFLRHYAALLDHHVIFDNGRTDDTVEIIRALKDEGLFVEVHQAASAICAEMYVNTLLYQLAREQGADWGLFLDCDGLIHLGHAPQGMLALAPLEAPCMHVPLIDCPGSTPESRAETNPFLRLVRRRAGPLSTAAEFWFSRTFRAVSPLYLGVGWRRRWIHVYGGPPRAPLLAFRATQDA